MNNPNGKTGHDDDSESRAAKLFSRYNGSKMERFQRWLATPHGAKVYSLFDGFARQWYEAGNDRCGASLLGNRIRWEMSVGEFSGYKIPNDYLPMMARKLAVDDRVFGSFFSFHGVGVGEGE